MSSNREENGELEKQPLISNENEQPKAPEKSSKMLVISFLMMVVFALGNKVFQKLQTIPMHNYVRVFL